MKLRVFIPVLLALMAGPALGMEKPYKSYLKPILGKLPPLGAAGLYGFIGWSAYQFIKNPKHKKLYAEDFNALGVRYLKTSEFAQDQWHVVYIAKRPIDRNEQLLVNYVPTIGELTESPNR